MVAMVNSILANAKFFNFKLGTKVLSKGDHDFPFEHRLLLRPFLPTPLVIQWHDPEAADVNVDIFFSVTSEVTTLDIYSEDFKKQGESFKVRGHLDLNTIPDAFKSHVFEREERKFSGCCCRDGGGMTLDFTLHKRGFALGEKVPFTATIVNTSDEILPEVTMQLLQSTEVKTAKYKKTQKIQVCDVAIGPKIKPGETLTWSGDDLRISNDLPLTCKNLCDILQIDYRIQIKHENIDSERDSIIMSKQIFIGSIPIPSKSTVTGSS